MKISIQMLIATIIAGLIYGVVGEVIYRVFHFWAPSPVVTLVYFGGLFAFIALALALINNIFYSQYPGKILKKSFLLSIALIIVCSLLFEFIYDLIGERIKIKGFDSYVFLIDNSGSMLQNDEYNLRYKAIEDLLADKKDSFEFAVYSFDDEVRVVRPMGPKKDGIDLGQPENAGQTHLYTAMQQLLDDQDAGILDMSSSTRVVVLTDGGPNDVYAAETTIWLNLLDKFADRKITVSTISLGDSQETFMSMVAEATGGVFVNCKDIDEIDGAFVKATAVSKQPRNLLGFRPGNYMNLLLGIMRVVFVIGLGLITALMKTAVCERFINTKSVFISSIIGGTLAGICIEIGMNGFGINATIMRIITCVLVSFTVLREDVMINNYNLVKENGGRSGALY